MLAEACWLTESGRASTAQLGLYFCESSPYLFISSERSPVVLSLSAQARVSLGRETCHLRLGDRVILSGVFLARTGAPWREVPAVNPSGTEQTP